MKTLLLLLSLLALPARADLSTHPVFKHYIGTWKAAGELKGENNVITIKEDWTGKADGDNSFLIEGTRTINGDTQPFKWVITYNVTTESCEAVLTGVDAAQMLRFEGRASGANATIELKSITGAGQSAITIIDSFKGESKNIMESKVTSTGEAGQTTLEGTIKHEKQKTP